MIKEIRWRQRFNNYTRALNILLQGVETASERKLSELEQQGIIQSFEFTFEVAWKTLKDYLEYMQVEAVFPRDVIKMSFQYSLIDNGDVWMDMLEKRNLMSHTYNEDEARTAIKLIMTSYTQQLHKLYNTLSKKKDEE